MINFWNTFSAKLRPIFQAFNGRIIVYQLVGANYQLPPEFLRAARPASMRVRTRSFTAVISRYTLKR